MQEDAKQQRIVGVAEQEEEQQRRQQWVAREKAMIGTRQKA